MDNRSLNLLEEALGLDDRTRPWPLSGKFVLVEDCVETSGSFVLHHLVKRAISSPQTSNAVIFVALSQPFSHYDRILRKLGCNLASQRDNGRFYFFDMLMLEGQDGCEGKATEGVLQDLYAKIHKAVSAVLQEKNSVIIVIDDISLLEIAVKGSSNCVLDLLHYCHTFTSEMGCSLVTLNHDDIYLSKEKPSLLLQMEYLADILIRTEPLATGLATDVHGQLSIFNKEISYSPASYTNMVRNFHFRIKESCVEYFYPGTRT